MVKIGKSEIEKTPACWSAFCALKRKGRDLNPRVKGFHLPDFESGAVPSWATFPNFNSDVNCA